MKVFKFFFFLISIIGIQLLLCWGHIWIWGHWSWLYFDGSLWVGTMIVAMLIGFVSSLISKNLPLLRLIGAVSSAIISGIAACMGDLITFQGGMEWVFIILLTLFAAFIGGMTALIGITKVIESFASSN